MTVAFPWSGRDVNALVPMSGRAAVPNTPAGAGFNWASLVGRVSGYIRPVRGWGLSGLGQDGSSVDLSTLGPFSYGTTGGIATPAVPTVDLSVLGTTSLSPAVPSIASMAASGASNASSQAPWWGNILAGALSSGLRTGSQIASYQLNPLYQKQTFYQTPQGAIYASNVGTGPGLPTATTGSMLPILLIGGMVLLFMGMRK